MLLQKITEFVQNAVQTITMDYKRLNSQEKNAFHPGWVELAFWAVVMNASSPKVRGSSPAEN